jgi:hypothetical protein
MKPHLIKAKPVTRNYDVVKTPTTNAIAIHGAREDNLKNFALEIPRNLVWV